MAENQQRIDELEQQARDMGASDELIQTAVTDGFESGDAAFEAVQQDRVASEIEDPAVETAKVATVREASDPEQPVSDPAPSEEMSKFYIPDVENPELPVYDLVPDMKNTHNNAGSIYEIMMLRATRFPDADLQELYDSAVRDVSSTDSIEALLSDEMSHYSAERQSEFLRLVNEQGIGGMSTDDLLDASNVKRDLEHLDEHFSQYVGFTSHIADEYADEDMESFSARRVEAEQYGFNLLQKELEDQGTWDKFSDVMGSIFVPNFITTINDLIPEHGPLASQTAFKQAINSFQTLDPFDQMAVAESLVPELLDAFNGNGVKAGIALNMFFSPNFEDAVATEGWLDAITIADYAAIGGSLASGAASFRGARGAARNKDMLFETTRNRFNKVQSFNSFENPEMAAVINWQSIDPRKSELPFANLTSPNDHIRNLSPVNVQNVPGQGGYVAGISPESVRLREGNMDAMAGIAETAGQNVTRRETRNLQRREAVLDREIQMLRQLDEGTLSGMRPKHPELYRTAIQESSEQLNIVRDILRTGRKPAAGEINENRIAQAVLPSSDANRAIRQAYDMEITPDFLESMANAARMEASTPRSQNFVSLGDITAHRRNRLADKMARSPEHASAGAGAGMSGARLSDLPETYSSPTSPERERVRGIMEDVVKPELIRANEAERLQRRMTERLQDQYQDAGKLIRNIDFDDVTEGSVTARVTTENGVDEYTYQITRTDAGNWLAENSTLQANTASTLTKIFTPQARLGGLPENLVEDVTFLGGQVARVRRELSSVFQDIQKPLSSKQRRDMYELLLVSDEQDVIFAPADMLSGAVETRLGKRPFDQEVVDAYYRFAATLDESHRFADYSIRRSLELDGFQELRYIDKDGATRRVVGQPHENFRAFDAEVTGEQFIYVSNTNSFVKIENISGLRENYRPVRLLEAEYADVGVQNPNAPAGARQYQKVEWMLIREGGEQGTASLHSLPERVLNKTNGVYIPRIYNPGYHYVRDMSTRRASTVRAFKTAREADEFIKNAAATNSDSRLVRFQDGDFSRYERMVNNAEQFGGLYTGARKKQPLLVEEGGETVRPQRLAANDSIQRYINSISDVVPMSEYRTMQVQRYKNTVDQLAQKEGKQHGFSNPNDWRSELTLANTNERVMMEEARNYMIQNLNIPTNEETRFRNLMQRVAMMSEGRWGRFGEGVKNNALNMAQANPVASLKGGTYHALLGWFNLRQLWVQAQNAALSISMYPQHALGASRDASLMRMAWNMSEDAQKIIARRGGLDADEFIENIRSFKRSGLEDSIRRNADLGAAQQQIGGVGMMRFRELARKGLVFYEEGELFGRLITWNIARRNLGQTGRRSLSDDDIMRLADETHRMHLNMQKENAAWWQTNMFTGPLTQFMQVQAKLIENVLPAVMGGTNRWTAREKSQALAGQVLLYGTVGVPVAEEAVNRIASMTGKSPEQVREDNPTLATQVNRGAVGVLAQSLGMNNDFSTAGSILSGMDESSLGNLVQGVIEITSGGYDDGGVFETMAGPSLTTIHRSGDAIGTTFGGIRDLVYSPTMEQLGDTAFNSLERFASIASSFSNARAVWQIEKMGGVTSRSGDMLVREDQLEGWNLQTQMARALGFSTNVEQDYWNRANFLRSERDMERETRTALMNNYRQFQMDGNLEAYQRDMARLLEPHDISTRIKLKQSFMDNVLNPESGRDSQDREFFERYIDSGGQVQAPFGASN